jgi:hypothetical protein
MEFQLESLFLESVNNVGLILLAKQCEEICSYSDNNVMLEDTMITSFWGGGSE